MGKGWERKGTVERVKYESKKQKLWLESDQRVEEVGMGVTPKKRRGQIDVFWAQLTELLDTDFS